MRRHQLYFLALFFALALANTACSSASATTSEEDQPDLPASTALADGRAETEPIEELAPEVNAHGDDVAADEDDAPVDFDNIESVDEFVTDLILSPVDENVVAADLDDFIGPDDPICDTSSSRPCASQTFGSVVEDTDNLGLTSEQITDFGPVLANAYGLDPESVEVVDGLVGESRTAGWTVFEATGAQDDSIEGYRFEVTATITFQDDDVSYESFTTSYIRVFPICSRDVSDEGLCI